MLEKNSTILLTKDDLNEFHSGLVSVRIQNQWGLSYQALSEIIREGNYVLVDNE